MDATGRLTYRLLNRDTRAKVGHRGLCHGDPLARFPLEQNLSCNTDVSLYFSVIVSGKFGCLL
ncbi:unnamed protein product [Tetraodon nigroviridis]|uniref:(spotted green pufferfish) hypothetical protein n=1 Tax=Tetraodon nigroviridis TaxID=99883 RepID=Q4SL27_TETNG|nr:unnamed protein product [Tetraodon nigroviridis]